MKDNGLPDDDTIISTYKDLFKGRDSVPPPPHDREIITCMRLSVGGVGGA